MILRACLILIALLAAALVFSLLRGKALSAALTAATEARDSFKAKVYDRDATIAQLMFQLRQRDALAAEAQQRISAAQAQGQSLAERVAAYNARHPAPAPSPPVEGRHAPSSSSDPNPAACGLDAAGLSLWNQSNSGAAEPAPCAAGADGGLPADVSTGSERGCAEPAQQSHAGHDHSTGVSDSFAGTSDLGGSDSAATSDSNY